MKKVIGLAVSVIAAAAINAYSDISVNWSSTGPVFGSNAGNDRYVQLIWSATDPSTHTAVWGSTDYLAPGEYLLFDFNNYSEGVWEDADVSDPDSWSNIDVGNNVIANGYLFTRVFESATVTSTTQYYQSTVINPTLPTYDSQNINTIIDHDATGGEVQTASNSMVMVPEPTSLALIGLGLGVIALRRMRK